MRVFLQIKKFIDNFVIRKENMGKSTNDAKFPITQGIRALQAAKIDFVPHLYPYEDHGGTKHAAKCLNISEHNVIKTLVMEATTTEGKKSPMVVLMHGDREVSTKQLARDLGVKTVSPASEANVEKYTGYQPGGVSPFGTRSTMPIYVESSILALDKLFINAGKRGLLVEITPDILKKFLTPKEVNVGIISS